MAVDESLGALSSVAVSNTPAGTDTVGPDLDDHLRDIKKNIRIAGETSQGPTAPTGFLGRQRLATSATGSNTLTHQVHDGSAFRSLYDVDTSAGTVSRFYARKGSMPGSAMSGTLSGVAVLASTFHGSASASGSFRGLFSGSASGRFTGDIRLEDGSSAAPSLGYANDPDTGWFLSSTGVLVLVTAGAGRFKVDASGHITKPTQSAFFARLSATQTNLPVNTGTQIQFDTERYDQNSDFNTGTFTFTAPVTGKYLFNVSVKLLNLSVVSASYELVLITTGVTYSLDKFIPADLVASGSSLYLRGSVIADMTAADTASVNVSVGAGGVAQTDVEHLDGAEIPSFFCGALLA